MGTRPLDCEATRAVPSGNSSTSPASTSATALSTRPLHSGSLAFALSAIAATASRQAARAGLPKSGAETSSQENSFTATMILTSTQTSALSIFNFRVEGLEFGTCVVDFELPIDPTLLLVASRGPRGGFRRKVLGVAKPAVVQTWTRQRTQFVFRDVEPTTVLGRVPKLEPPDELPGSCRVKRFVKRPHRVRV